MPDTTMHENHRARLKSRFRDHGLDSFTDIQVLEMLLFYVIPRKDTNPIAHRLLERFQTFSQVLDAPLEELEKVEGIGKEAALFLKMIPASARYYMVDNAKREVILDTFYKCGKYLENFFIGSRVEKVYLLCLDAKCKVLCCVEICEGSVNSAGISVRKVVEKALAAKATSVILAHNHPSGIALPSSEDLQTTKRIAEGLRAVEIPLVDHIIVADGDHISMASSGHRFDEYLLL